MRIRQLIIRLVVVGGLVAAMGGLLYAWSTDDMFVGSVWLVVGVGLMAGSAVYSLAMDDVEARSQALSTNRHTPDIDLRDPVQAPERKKADTWTRVGV
jgi:hypothetical protein